MGNSNHIETMASIEQAQLRFIASNDLLNRCFSEDLRIQAKILGEYLSHLDYVLYKGTEICLGVPIHQIDSCIIPQELLESYYLIMESKEECTAWIRMWSMLAESIDDFTAGLPGGSLHFSTEELTEQYNEMSTSSTFKEIEGKYYAQLLLGK